MHGNLHIFVRGDEPGQPGPEYQVDYTVPGKTYSRVYTELKLKDFLRSTIGLSEDMVVRITRQLHQTAKFTLPDVDFNTEDIDGLDFAEVPVDV